MAAPKEEETCKILQYNMKINKNNNLGLPPQYQGSNMFMPNGERLYWQAEVVPPSMGSTTCQDFEEIRSRCLTEDVLFEDPEFPAAESSLSAKPGKFLTLMKKNAVKWLRPRDLVDTPQLCLEGYSRFDVNQGKLGDCWMDCVLATLTMHKKLFNQVVPDDQGFDKDYAGVFHFRFWQYGRWVDVVIDDRLPTSDGKLLFLSSTQQNEFWSALLEKAYAKLHGSYESLVNGFPSDAMEDFSGGLTECHDVVYLNKDIDHSFNCLIEAYERNSLITAGTNFLLIMMRGIVPAHGYSVTGVKYLDANMPLLRIRNPIGHTEWTGAWNDHSPEWNLIPQDKKKALGLIVQDDGEFWMTFQDFLKYFSSVYICNLNPESLHPEDYPKHCNRKWEVSMFEGKWEKDETSDGWFTEHWKNPQYRITISDPDEEDDENTCDVTISLLQKFKRTRLSKIFLEIGFFVYKIEDDLPNHLEPEFFRKRKPIYVSEHQRLIARGVSAKLKLIPGTYVIIPCIYEIDEEGEFFLRVISEKRRDVTQPSPQVILV